MVGLEENGFVADSFAEPLAALQNFKADLLDQLIIDIMMPALNSLDLNQEMRSVEDKFNFFLTVGHAYY
ncbi:MAG: hypothetical protein M3044_14205 [Thermoproteota archaeon]|nr:hypothetical protein [Thermoproteota archaeon]